MKNQNYREVLIPSKKKAEVGDLGLKDKHIELFTQTSLSIKGVRRRYKPQHLYFVSNEGIKEGSYCISKYFSPYPDIIKIQKSDDYSLFNMRIIATTNKELIGLDGITQIPKESIDNYVESNNGGKIKKYGKE